MASLPGQERCISCGRSATPLRWYRDKPFCDECDEKVCSGENLEATFLPDPLGPAPQPAPEKRFKELFKAARVLLKKNAVDEHQIYPTLAFANEIGQGNMRVITAKEGLARAANSPEEW